MSVAPNSLATQPTLFGDCRVNEAVSEMANLGAEARGAIFTKREVVHFILDLVGFTVEARLPEMRLLEPSFGNGDFLIPAVERLLDVWKSTSQKGAALDELGGCIRAVELHRSSYERAKEVVGDLLTASGIPEEAATAIIERWLILGDFLLVPLSGAFDVVVGNPPYVRQELIPDALLNEYRLRYRTIYDRADLYVPFIERSLISLNSGGALAFICADRWMKNRYGGPLRRLVSGEFHLKYYVDMTDTPAFHSDVIAYPGITVIARECGSITRVASRPEISDDVLSSLSAAFLAKAKPDAASGVREVANIVIGEEPWIFDGLDQVALVRRLERAFPTLAEAGCKVGIGVATGADRQFIGKFEELDVEPSRKLPLVMTRDILSGDVCWRGLGVVNPFEEAGGLVKLADYPLLKRYLEARKDEIAGRHVAKKAPDNWYRTIDRITPSIALEPKLLIPDIKGDAHIVYEDGRLYPHHNLYYIMSEEWDLRALQAVLLSGIARLFVSTYSTKMHGGFLRFQAQYLRRIRVPKWNDVPGDARSKLAAAAERKDAEACKEEVCRLYGLSKVERTAFKANGANNGN